LDLQRSGRGPQRSDACQGRCQFVADGAQGTFARQPVRNEDDVDVHGQVVPHPAPSEPGLAGYVQLWDFGGDPFQVGLVVQRIAPESIPGPWRRPAFGEKRPNSDFFAMRKVLFLMRASGRSE